MWKKIRKSRIFSLIKILFFIAICFAIGATAAYINHESDPTDYAMKYFEAFVAEDYDTMYEMIDVVEDQYMDKDVYIQNMKKARKSMVIDTYEIIDPVESEGTYLVNFMCLDIDNDNSQSFMIYLNQKREGLQIIPDYKINVDKMMVKNVSIDIPSGYELLLNNKSITDVAEITTEGKRDVYTIPALLGGNYTISAQQGPKALRKNVDVVKTDTVIEVKGKEYTASNSYYEQITTTSKELLNQFYDAVKNRNPEKKALMKITNNQEVQTQISQLVAESQEIVYWKDIKTIADYTVTEMVFTPYDINIVYDEDNNCYLVNYSYSYDYKAETETSLYNSYVYMLTGTCVTSVDMVYSIENESVVLNSITMTNENTRKEDNSLRKPKEN